MTYQFVLTALADPTRRQIFDTLRGTKRSVADIARQQPVSRPAVSQHLKVLSNAGLVNIETVGTRHYYSVNQEGLRELRDYLDSFWSDVLVAFANEVENSQKSTKENQND